MRRLIFSADRRVVVSRGRRLCPIVTATHHHRRRSHGPGRAGSHRHDSTRQGNAADIDHRRERSGGDRRRRRRHVPGHCHARRIHRCAAGVRARRRQSANEDQAASRAAARERHRDGGGRSGHAGRGHHRADGLDHAGRIGRRPNPAEHHRRAGGRRECRPRRRVVVGRAAAGRNHSADSDPPEFLRRRISRGDTRLCGDHHQREAAAVAGVVHHLESSRVRAGAQYVRRR